jgi:hypothetical protein
MDLDVVWNDQLLLRKDVLHLEQRCLVVVVGGLINVSNAKCNMLVAQRNSSSVGNLGLGIHPDCYWSADGTLSALPAALSNQARKQRESHSSNLNIRCVKQRGSASCEKCIILTAEL